MHLVGKIKPVIACCALGSQHGSSCIPSKAFCASSFCQCTTDLALDSVRPAHACCFTLPGSCDHSACSLQSAALLLHLHGCAQASSADCVLQAHARASEVGSHARLRAAHQTVFSKEDRAERHAAQRAKPELKVSCCSGSVGHFKARMKAFGSYAICSICRS